MHALWLDYLNAFRNVTRQTRRSLFGIAAVACGVIALLLASGFIEWIFWASREGAIHNGLGHIQVARTGYNEFGAANPGDFLLDPDPTLIKQLQHASNVQLVAPRLAFNGLISKEDATISFLGEGVDPVAERTLSRDLLITQGKNLDENDPNGIIIGQGLAKNMGVNIGDAVILLTTTSRGMNAAECHVRGFFNTTSKAYDDTALRVPLAMAQKLMRTNGVHRYILMLDNIAETAQTTVRLQQTSAALQLEFTPWYQLADFYNKLIKLLSMQVGVVEFIIAAIIVLSISNTLTMNVLERTAEIGTCLAIGRTRRQIRRQFIFEGVTVGLLGGFIGLIAGSLLAWLISWIGIPMPPPPGMSQGYTGEILITPSLAGRALLLALGTSLLASLYPSWKASRLEIVDALRHNR